MSRGLTTVWNKPRFDSDELEFSYSWCRVIALTSWLDHFERIYPIISIWHLYKDAMVFHLEGKASPQQAVDI